MIEYNLTGGGTLKRIYSYDFDMAKQYLTKLFATEEGKLNTFIVFNKKFKLPDKIQIMNAADNKRIFIENSDHIEYFTYRL
jgi:hypothetical protein